MKKQPEGCQEKKHVFSALYALFSLDLSHFLLAISPEGAEGNYN